MRSVESDERDTTERVVTALTDAVAELADEMETDAFEAVVSGGASPTSDDLDALPESWTEDALIRPLLSAVGVEKAPGRPCDRREVDGDVRWEIPDFRLVDDDWGFSVVGEAKPPGRLEEAETDLLEEYLTSKAWPDFGVATTGVEWVVYRAEHGGDFLEFQEAARVDFGDTLRGLARERGHLPSSPPDRVETGPVERFGEQFSPDALDRLLTEEAPREFRERRRRSVDDFYDRYVELLFGEGERTDCAVSLRAAVSTPPGTEDRRRDLFVVSLVNRLLFVRLLELRGVLEPGLLVDLVDEYESRADDSPGTLYGAVVEPLFYELLNTPPSERAPKHRTGRFSEVPYLNGGLFREPTPPESEFRVPDAPLTAVVRELVAGIDLDDAEFDPALLGSVFEKTINHIGGETGRQAEVGAYYTPADVTRHVTERTVDAKVHDLAVETFAANPGEGYDSETVREAVAETELQTLLREVETGPGAFGESHAALSALLDAVGDLTVLDPACGSGHFLTTAMEELHRVQYSLLRGLDDGRPPSDERLYEAKRRLALNVVHGVDVDAVAVEIARLRVWLKMIDDGYDQTYGRLPNVDVNVVRGNSLVGLPILSAGSTQVTGRTFDDRLDRLAAARTEYLDGETADRSQVAALTEDLREDCNEVYLNALTHTVETTVREPETLDATFADVPAGEVYPTLSSVRARRLVDGEPAALGGEDKERLARAGFEWQSWRDRNRSARLDVDRVLSASDTATSRPDRAATLLDDLRRLLADGYTLELERQPTPYDLAGADAAPVHWGAQFPELRRDDAGGLPSISVDVVLGNPPYGDVLPDAERAFTAPYRTGSIREVSAQFVERQLQLLDDDGYLGNVTTLRLFYQSSLESFHDLLRDRLETADVACFGSRPAKLFDDADVRVALLTGRRGDGDGEIRTSRMRLFTEATRGECFDTLSYASTEGLVLRDRIGGDGDGGPILPKVGTETVRGLLSRLRGQSDELLSDRYDRGSGADGDHPVWRREGVRYWINPMLERLYDAREVTALWFDSELERRTAFLVLQSSPYYVYWSAYGNQHHHTWTQLSAFPWPDDDRVRAAADRIDALSRRLWDGMVESYTETTRGTGSFDTGRVRETVGEVDTLVGELYGLSDEQVAYATAYLTDLGPGLGRAGYDEPG